MRWILIAMLAAHLCGCSAVVSTRPMGEAPLDLADQADKWTGTWRSPMGPCMLTVVEATNGVLAMTSTKPQSWWRWSNETHRIYLRTGGDWTYASVDYTEGTNACYLWGKVANDDGTILWWQPDPAKFRPLVESGALPGTIEKMKKKKKQEQQSPYPIVGYAPSGEAIYQMPGTSGAPTETFTPELEVPTADPFPADTEDETESGAGDTPLEAGRGEPACTNISPQTDDTIGYTITLGDLEPKHYELIAAASNGVMFDWERPYVMVKQSGRADLRYLRAATKRWMREQGK